MNKFYVYEWYIVETNHVFHVGKGCGNRLYNITDRNKYFKRIIATHNVAVRIYKDNLTEQEAWDLEKKHIAELKNINQCETNFHIGGRGGDTTKYMNDEDYKLFCKHVGDKTAERSKNKEYIKNLSLAVKKAMNNPEIRHKVSERTKIAMSKPDTYEAMWERGLSSPVILIFKNKQYKIFKIQGDLAKYLKDEFDLGGRWTVNLLKQQFKISCQTKNNKNIENLVGAKAYKIPKNLFRSVTTMADECKPVDEILSLIEAQDNLI